MRRRRRDFFMKPAPVSASASASEPAQSAGYNERRLKFEVQRVHRGPKLAAVVRTVPVSVEHREPAVDELVARERAVAVAVEAAEEGIGLVRCVDGFVVLHATDGVVVIVIEVLE